VVSHPAAARVPAATISLPLERVRGRGASLHAADMPPRPERSQFDPTAGRPVRQPAGHGGRAIGMVAEKRPNRQDVGRPPQEAGEVVAVRPPMANVSPPRRLPLDFCSLKETDCARWRGTGKPVGVSGREARDQRAAGLRRCYFDRARLLIRRRQRWLRCPVPAREQAAPAGTPCSPPYRLRLRRPERSSRIG
jgi:hypothetical protein